MPKVYGNEHCISFQNLKIMIGSSQSEVFDVKYFYVPLFMISNISHEQILPVKLNFTGQCIAENPKSIKQAAKIHESRV